MSEEVLLCAHDVGKRYCRDLKRSLWYGVQDIADDILGFDHRRGTLRRDEFWAVQDVSFELKRGQCLGLIGRNGAGKTTLLKMINGLVKPDRGQIRLRGRVGGLIALGAGFSPILTGRENIYINGSILGIDKREVDAKFDEILDFAEIGEFIDAPVQSYSSGMAVRLGFAVAAVLLKPDVLLLDEVLAVGDIGFTIKCFNAVRTLCQDAAVVFVSHNMQLVSSFCDRLIVMKQGQILTDTADITEGLDVYSREFPVTQHTSGTGEAQVSEIACSAPTPRDSPESEPAFKQGEALQLRFRTDIAAGSGPANVSLVIKDHAMKAVLYCPINDERGENILLESGTRELDLSLSHLDLAPGKYSCVIVIADAATKICLCRVEGTAPFRILGDKVPWASVVRPVRVQTAEHSRR